MPLAGAACSSCHGSNFVTGGFKITTTPSLSTANHTVVASLTCVSCHESNATDLAFQGVSTKIYVRPGTVAAGLSPVDAAHATGAMGTANCAQCHTTTPPFAGGALPSNHIPLPATATPTSATCHSAGYSPTVHKMVHSAVTSESCTSCHGAGKGPFAGTSQGTGGQPNQPPRPPATPGTATPIPAPPPHFGPPPHHPNLP